MNCPAASRGVSIFIADHFVRGKPRGIKPTGGINFFTLTLQKILGEGAGGIKKIRTATIGSSMFDVLCSTFKPKTLNPEPRTLFYAVLRIILRPPAPDFMPL